MEKLEEEGAQENKDVFEENLTWLCYESSKLFIQIQQFLNEGSHFKKAKFLYNGVDL